MRIADAVVTARCTGECPMRARSVAPPSSRQTAPPATHRAKPRFNEDPVSAGHRAVPRGRVIDRDSPAENRINLSRIH